jgi:hypothetical protein
MMHVRGLSMDKLITYDEMKAALEGCVAERGADFVYPEEWKRESETPYGFKKKVCQYVNEDGTPGCIIGMAVMKNWPHIELREATGADEILDLYADSKASALAMECQLYQDDGHSWGESLSMAIQYAEEEYEQD